MSRTPAVLREAGVGDAGSISELWAGSLRRGCAEQQTGDVRRLIVHAEADEDSRVVVAECDGTVVGAVYLRVSTLTPINLEPVVLVLSPHVLPSHRRRGVGRQLLDAAASWAEERGIAHVGSGAVSGDREANRFLARLGFASLATLRVVPAGALSARLRPELRGGDRQRPLGDDHCQ